MTEIVIERSDAIYFFFINKKEDQVRVTKFVRKDQDGYDMSSSTTVEGARQWYKQLIR